MKEKIRLSAYFLAVSTVCAVLAVLATDWDISVKLGIFSIMAFILSFVVGLVQTTLGVLDRNKRGK